MRAASRCTEVDTSDRPQYKAKYDTATAICSGTFLRPMSALIEFFFPRRVHRLDYFLRGTAVEIVACFIYAFSPTATSSLPMYCFVALSAYDLFFVVLPRMRDLEMSAWSLLALVVPVVNVALAFVLQFRAPVFTNKIGTILKPEAHSMAGQF